MNKQNEKLNQNKEDTSAEEQRADVFHRVVEAQEAEKTCVNTTPNSKALETKEQIGNITKTKHHKQLQNNERTNNEADGNDNQSHIRARPTEQPILHHIPTTEQKHKMKHETQNTERDRARHRHTQKDIRVTYPRWLARGRWCTR